MRPSKFAKILKRPVSPLTVQQRENLGGNLGREFLWRAQIFRGQLRTFDLQKVVYGLQANDKLPVSAREVIKDINEWLDELDQKLGKPA
jgi:hypothetical protein